MVCNLAIFILETYVKYKFTWIINCLFFFYRILIYLFHCFCYIYTCSDIVSNHDIDLFVVDLNWMKPQAEKMVAADEESIVTIDPEQNSAYHQRTPHLGTGRLATWKVMYKSTVESD